MPESSYVLRLKAELKQLLEDRKQASPGREYDKIEHEIDLTRKEIRASRMRDRRRTGVDDETTKRRKRTAKKRQLESDKLYLAEEAEIYTLTDTFVDYHSLTGRRRLACYTCLNRLEVGDRLYRFPEEPGLPNPEASFIHVSCRVPHHMINRDRKTRGGYPSALNIPSEATMRIFIELERERRAEQKPVEYVRVDNLQRMREGRSRVVG